jgi:hypothetical protein
MPQMQLEKKTRNEPFNEPLASLISKRIVPAESGKSAEITIGRMDLGVGLKSDGSNVCIGSEVAPSQYIDQQVPQQLKMTWPRLQNHDVDCASQPAIRSNACSIVSGLGNALRFVLIRKNPSRTIQANPTGSVPESTSSNQPFARS